MKSIGARVFANVLISCLDLPPTVEKIDYNAFVDSLLVPEINNEEFYTEDQGTIRSKKPKGMFYCSQIINEIEEGIKILHGNSFYKCVGIISIVFPKSLRIIGRKAFFSSGLENVKFHSDSHVSIGGEAFAYSKVKQILLPIVVDYLGNYIIPSGELIFPPGFKLINCHPSAFTSIVKLVIPRNALDNFYKLVINDQIITIIDN